MKKLKETKTVYLPHKNSKLILMEVLIITERIKMKLTKEIIIITIIIIILIIIIIIIIIIIAILIIIKCRGRYRTPATTNTKLLVT